MLNHSYWNSKEPNGIEPAEKPHEECGVFGLYGDDVMPPAYAAYNGLLALQHRGQESCGIAVNDRGVVSYHKDMGLVSEVFHPKDLDKLSGQMCVSHVRYSTAGDSVPENAQPLVMRYIKGTLAIAHNGNLTNAHEIRRELEHRGAIFQTTIDSEVIAYIIARERMHSGSIEEAVRRTMPQIQGAYSLLVMSPQKLIAARDPNGFRPLCRKRRPPRPRPDRGHRRAAHAPPHRLRALFGRDGQAPAHGALDLRAARQLRALPALPPGGRAPDGAGRSGL